VIHHSTCDIALELAKQSYAKYLHNRSRGVGSLYEITKAQQQFDNINRELAPAK